MFQNGLFWGRIKNGFWKFFTRKSVQKISKTTYFVIIKSGLSIGVQIEVFCEKNFIFNFDTSGGPLRKKSQYFLSKKSHNLHTNRKP
jgi:hypothetical protein